MALRCMGNERRRIYANKSIVTTYIYICILCYIMHSNNNDNPVFFNIIHFTRLSNRIFFSISTKNHQTCYENLIKSHFFYDMQATNTLTHIYNIYIWL